MKILHDRNKGSILIFCLWAVGFLSFLTLHISGLVKQEILVFQRVEARNDVYRGAEAAVFQAIRYLNQTGSGVSMDLLKISSINKLAAGDLGAVQYWVGEQDDQNVDSSKTQTNSQISALIDYYDQNQTQYGIMDHSRRINLNHANRYVLEQIFEKIAGLEEVQAVRLAGSVLDYRDLDDSVSSLADGTGSELEVYRYQGIPYTPKNSDYEFVGEMLRVPGMTEAVFRSIENYITVYGDGQVNLNTAPAPVLMALGFSDALVQKFILFRAGKDAKPDTEDDHVFTNAAFVERDLSGVFDLDEREKIALRHVIARRQAGVNSSVFDIVGYASKSGSGKLKVKCVYQLNKGVLNWIEG